MLTPSRDAACPIDQPLQPILLDEFLWYSLWLTPTATNSGDAQPEALTIRPKHLTKRRRHRGW
jgi:hypothetical protein